MRFYARKLIIAADGTIKKLCHITNLSIVCPSCETKNLFLDQADLLTTEEVYCKSCRHKFSYDSVNQVKEYHRHLYFQSRGLSSFV
jgi:uncharacterized protein YbaR (Trm112 family)